MGTSRASRGHSMTGKVNDGQLCTVVPIEDHMLAVHDIVLCRVKGNQYLHLVKALHPLKRGAEGGLGVHRGRTLSAACRIG